MNAYEIYAGSNGEATTALYAQLTTIGPLGSIARDLFRACKTSERAKGYRRRIHKQESYGRKNWSLGLAVDTLLEHAATYGIKWGWKQDPNPPVGFPWVLYIELPNGQCSFHAPARGKGPDYAGEWDKSRTSAHVIVNFTQGILNGVRSITYIDDGPHSITREQWEFLLNEKRTGAT